MGKLSYDLQQSDRAVVVGELTAGAATFHYPYRISAHLMSAVPSGYPVNPRSGTNWEGGVRPDVAVPAEHAFDTAYRLALEHVLTLENRGARREIAAQATTMLTTLDPGWGRENRGTIERPA